MSTIEYEEYKQKLIALGPELEKLSAALDIDGRRRRRSPSWRPRPPRRASGTIWSGPRRSISA
jgi:hypothetical protein